MVSMRIQAFLAACAAAFCLVGPAFAAGDTETPTALTGGKVVTVDDAKKLLDGGGVAFVDTRNPLNFAKGHVPGAKTAAYKEKSDKVKDFDSSADSFELDKLPTDKAARIVFYSDGPTGWKSYKAAVLAIKAGYKNVMYYRGGITEWTAKGMPVEK